MAKKKTKLLET